MKKLIYLTSLVLLLSACSTTPPQAPIEITKEYLASNAHKRQYSRVKNNDLNLWWQRWKDPSVLEILRDTNSVNYSSHQAKDILKILDKRYNLQLTSPEWLNHSISNEKEYKLIQQDKYWYDARTLLATATVKQYVDYIICNMEKESQSLYNNTLLDIDKSSFENLKTNIKNEIKESDNQIKEITQQCKNLEKSLLYITQKLPKQLEITMSKSEAPQLIYNNSNIFSFPDIIDAKILMGRADIALAIQQFDIEWAKLNGKLEPISIEGIISPFSAAPVLEDNIFAIGGIAVHFPLELRNIEKDNPTFLEKRDDILKKIQNAALEINTHMQKNETLTTNVQNAKYREQQTLQYLEDIKGQGVENEEFLIERKRLAQDSLKFYSAQKERIAHWLELYLLTGIGFQPYLNNETNDSQ